MHGGRAAASVHGSFRTAFSAYQVGSCGMEKM